MFLWNQSLFTHAKNLDENFALILGITIFNTNDINNAVCHIKLGLAWSIEIFCVCIGPVVIDKQGPKLLVY